jgi:hypothetical protein
MINLTELPSVLYRYRPTSSEYFEEEVRQLKRNGVFLTPAIFLNDPFDCSPAIEPSPISDVRREIRKFGFESFRKLRMDRAKESGLYGKEDLKKLRSQYKSSVAAAKFEAPLANSVFDVYRQNDLLVSCFSEVYHSVLMWTHYAESHKGFVVKYSVSFPSDVNSTSALPLPVVYVDDRPKFSTIDILRWRLQPESSSSLIDDVVQEGLYLTKSVQWKAEREWRLVENIRKGNGYYYYDNLIPTEIIAGVNIPEEKLAFMMENLPDISFKQATLHPSSFELVFQTIR